MTTGLAGCILTHMKTTIDIADSLFLRSKKLARERGLTLRTLVEEGLHASLERHERQAPFRFRPVTVKGKGLAVEAQDGGWATIGQAIYRGRGA